MSSGRLPVNEREAYAGVDVVTLGHFAIVLNMEPLPGQNTSAAGGLKVRTEQQVHRCTQKAMGSKLIGGTLGQSVPGAKRAVWGDHGNALSRQAHPLGRRVSDLDHGVVLDEFHVLPKE